MEPINKCILTDEPIHDFKECEGGFEYSLKYEGISYKLRFPTVTDLHSSYKQVLKAMLYRKEWPFIPEAVITKDLFNRMLEHFNIPVDDNFNLKVLYYLEWLCRNGGRKHEELTFHSSQYLAAFARDEKELIAIYEELLHKDYIRIISKDVFKLTSPGIKVAEEFIAKTPKREKVQFPENISRPTIVTFFAEEDILLARRINMLLENEYHFRVIQDSGIENNNYLGASYIANEMSAYIKRGSNNPADYVLFYKSKNSNSNHTYGVLLTKISDIDIGDNRKFISVLLIDDSPYDAWASYINSGYDFYDVRIVKRIENLADAIAVDWIKLLAEKEKIKIKTPDQLLEWLISWANHYKKDAITIQPAQIKEIIDEPHLQYFLKKLVDEEAIIFRTYPGYGSDEFEYYVTILNMNQDTSDNTNEETSNGQDYVNISRIKEIQDIKSKWDTTRLIALCKELNECKKTGSVFAIAGLVRTIINHIPPIFGQKNFESVIAQYNGEKNSIKKSLANLNSSMKNISDYNLHAHADKVDSLPNFTQVDCSRDLDVLLAEVCKSLKHGQKNV